MIRRVSIFLGLTLSAAGSGPRYTVDNELLRPDDYREWVFLSSGLGMTYGPNAAPAADPRFDNVFVNPEAYRAFVETGQWPDQTIFALEIRKSVSKGSINKDGRFQTERVAVEFEVKDEKRFPQKWGFFGFNDKEGALPKSAKAFPVSAGCIACHSANGAVENTFVQFYPTLIDVARRKGTLKAGKE